MAYYHSIKQLEEKNVSSEIEIMLWSDRMDIVALANVKGFLFQKFPKIHIYQRICFS